MTADHDKEPDVPRARQKLVESKTRWAREGRLLTGTAAPRADRLPPGQHRVTDWPVLDLGTQPEVAPAAWHLDVEGLVAHPVSWDWPSFQAQPQFNSTSDIHCVTAWSRYAGRGWRRGICWMSCSPAPEARFIVFHSYDDYTTNLPLADFDDEDVLLAHSWDGKPLPRAHGGPVRVVVPKLYFWKSAKWVRRIEFIAADRRGFWEERGYHDHGDPWTEERYG